MLRVTLHLHSDTTVTGSNARRHDTGRITKLEIRYIIGDRDIAYSTLNEYKANVVDGTTINVYTDR